MPVKRRESVPQAVDSIAVANFFIAQGIESSQPLDHLKLQKILFYAHGWHLQLYEAPLIDGGFEAWAYGPVCPPVYREFKRFGDRPITGLGTQIDKSGNGLVPALLSRSENLRLRPLLEKIWDEFGVYTGLQLYKMTHRPGTPWSKVVEDNGGSPGYGVPIPDDLIRVGIGDGTA